MLLALVTLSVSPVGCNGLLASSAPTDDEPSKGEPVPADDASLPDVADVYGAKYQGDGDMCGAVICGGGQVCCVVSIPSDAPTPNPNNKCDYECTAVCMDECPAVTLTEVDADTTTPLHGGGIVPPGADGND
jgi:hypothetical protein